MPQLSAEARNLNWLVGKFARETSGVAHALVLSADGLPIAVSGQLDRPRAEQLAAIASGLASLTDGAARCFGAGSVLQTAVEMTRGHLFVMAINGGACLAVLAGQPSNVGVIAYNMALLVARVGDALTPTLRAELQSALPS